MSSSARNAHITTVSGRDVRFLAPDPETLLIEDGARALSRLCRFGGHLSDDFADDIYSVAQHSCYVHDHLVATGQREAAPWGLMHDWPEGIFGDTVTPLKGLVPDLEWMEDRLAGTVRRRWSIPYDADIARQVHEADRAVGCAEAFHLKGRRQASRMYGRDAPPFHLSAIDRSFRCWRPDHAYQQFMRRADDSVMGRRATDTADFREAG